jgi:hypothetical protein
MAAPRRALALALLTLASACGRDDFPPRPPRAPIHACELITPDEADPKGALGLSPVGNAVDESTGVQSAKCAFGTVDLPVHVVSVEVRRFADEGAARSDQRVARGMFRGLAGEEPRDVPELGDEATWAGGRLDQLHVRTGDTRLIVAVEVGEDATREARAIALARLALGRLGKAAH